jgi:nicotinamidase-related amidase
MHLPVRFTGDRVDEFEYATLPLHPQETALLLVDCEGDCGPSCNPVLESRIAPALAACRSIGVRPVYLYNESWPNRSREMVREVHYTRRGRPIPPSVSDPAPPEWAHGITPHQGDLVIGKTEQSGFIGTDLDTSLRGLGVDTLLAVGFSFKSCLFQTIVNAFQYNYRVIFLRDGTDPPGTNEFPDTGDESLPEKGWVRLVLTRLIEDHLGYSSTCKELVDTCDRFPRASNDLR